MYLYMHTNYYLLISIAKAIEFPFLLLPPFSYSHSTFLSLDCFLLLLTCPQNEASAVGGSCFALGAEFLNKKKRREKERKEKRKDSAA